MLKSELPDGEFICALWSILKKLYLNYVGKVGSSEAFFRTDLNQFPKNIHRRIKMSIMKFENISSLELSKCLKVMKVLWESYIPSSNSDCDCDDQAENLWES